MSRCADRVDTVRTGEMRYVTMRVIEADERDDWVTMIDQARTGPVVVPE